MLKNADAQTRKNEDKMNFDDFLTELQKEMLDLDRQWTAGVTSVSHYYLGFEDAKSVMDGCLHHADHEPHPDDQKKISKQNYQDFIDNGPGDHPPAFDWRNLGGHNFVTPVKNQRNCASCVAFSVAAAIESNVRIGLKLPVDVAGSVIFEDVSEAQLFYGNSSSCSMGLILPDVLNYCQKTGVVPAGCFPYDVCDPAPKCKDAICPEWKEKQTRITGYTRLDTHHDMKQWIATKGPVIASMHVSDDFFLYRNGVYEFTLGNELGGHGMCCIGYDDIRHAWLFKNSMGTDWGMDGYVWVRYGQCGVDSHMFGINGFSQVHTVECGSPLYP